jgi:DNA-binding SARP family transcriptional activator
MRAREGYVDLDLRDEVVVLERSSAGRRIDLLQRFQVTDGERIVQLPFVAQRLLAFLGLSDRPQARVHTAGVMWPDADEHHALANLRSTLWRLNGITPPLVVREPSLRLSTDITVDVRSAYSLASRVLDPSISIADLAPDPTSWFVHDILPDWNEEWVVIERERFRQARLHSLEALCDRFADAGLMMQAIEAGFAAVTADPFRESGHRALIRTHIREGNRSEAIRQYVLYRRILDEELGIEPTAELTQLLGRFTPAQPPGRRRGLSRR